MNKDNFRKEELLYHIAVAHEKTIEDPDDISLSIKKMLADIRSLGYDEYQYLADIKLRNIKDRRIMKVLLNYYDEMDLVTKDALMYKIHPKYFPEVVNIAKKEFLNLGPSDRRCFNGFQIAMSRGQVSDAYIEEMFDLLDVGEQYAAMSEVRKRLCRIAPDRMIPLIERYSNSVLALCTIQDCSYLINTNYAISLLKRFANISEDELICIKLVNNQNLNVTVYEYYRDMCTVSRIQGDAMKVLKKMTKMKV